MKTHAALLQKPLAGVVHSDEKGGGRKKVMIDVGKYLGVIASVALSAYIGLQQGISERPTRDEVNANVVELSRDRIVRIFRIERRLSTVSTKLDAVSEDISEIKDELKYLRRGGRGKAQ